MSCNSWLLSTTTIPTISSPLSFKNATILSPKSGYPSSFSLSRQLNWTHSSSSSSSYQKKHSLSSIINSFISPPELEIDNNGGGGGEGGGFGNNNNNKNHRGGNSDEWWGWNNNNNNTDSGGDYGSIFLLYLFLFFCGYCQFHSNSALARTTEATEETEDVVWEVRGGKWIRLLPDPDPSKDSFIIVDTKPLSLSLGLNLWRQCKELFIQLMLPEGYPNSVSSDYLDYSLWRGVQGVASQISGVLSTQALLYAVGLGKGAIPTAAAVSWVLKDGIGYLSKILLSKYGRHFDVHPKGWRLFADLMENAAYGMELLTPAFPHLFVFIGAAAGASRSAAALIQAATRSCFYAGFAAQRNFAEVIAKGEAQGMVSKWIGIMLGIGLANCINSSTPLAFASFSVVTAIHMFCNLRSYQSIQLRTLNPYRASLVFSEYLLSGQVPPVKEVNDEEPLFPGLQLGNVGLVSKAEPQFLSDEAKDAAVQIEARLQLGSKLSQVVQSKDDALALIELYKNEGYMLTEHEGRYCVVLKEGSSPHDMLRSLFHVNYLYWLEKNVGIEPKSAADDCRQGGKLQISLDYVQREFDHIKHDGNIAGWVTDGLIARPLANRIRLQNVAAPISKS